MGESRKEEFDYQAAVKELEEIVEKVESPDTGIGDIAGYMARSRELVAECREYLRTVRDQINSED